MLLNILESILYGLIEGITEWLPISSTGHLLLLESILPMNVSKEFFEVYMVVIQLGAVAAVCIYFFDKLYPFNKSRKQQDAIYQTWIKIIIGCIPAGIFGILLNDWIDEHLFSTTIVAVMLIVYGILFIVIERWNETRDLPIRKVSQLSYYGALTIGFIQVLALIPGTSRSGTTILGAMLLGVARPAAAEFSFFLSIPVMAGASLLKLIKYGFHFTGSEIVILLFGVAAAFAVSMAIIRILMDFIKTHDFKVFGIYRIILGVIVIIYFALAH